MVIKGITIELLEKTEVGYDPFGRPIEDEIFVEIDNVLVSPASSDDIVSSTDLYGKKAVYTLGIPKGDTHNWIDTKVRFWGQTFKTFGFPTEGIETMIPLEWNKKVMVEVYG